MWSAQHNQLVVCLHRYAFVIWQSLHCCYYAVLPTVLPYPLQNPTQTQSDLRTCIDKQFPCGNFSCHTTYMRRLANHHRGFNFLPTQQCVPLDSAFVVRPTIVRLQVRLAHFLSFFSTHTLGCSHHARPAFGLRGPSFFPVGAESGNEEETPPQSSAAPTK